MTGLDIEKARQLVRLALEEDIGSGDITTETVIPADRSVKAEIRAKQECVICGLPVAELVFRSLDEDVDFKENAKDGDHVKPGQVLALVSGNARALLTGERTALNFMQRLSGIATKTRHLVDAVKGDGVSVLDTRKTTPGMRMLEKYAVRCGGGKNHRSGLYDAILIKDNHIKLAGLEPAVRKAKETGKRVEVEVNSVEEARQAVRAGADIIMLDNMGMDDMRHAIEEIDRKATIEVSGGINGGNIAEIAKLGVDWISVGKLTHSVQAVEIGMDIV